MSRFYNLSNTSFLLTFREIFVKTYIKLVFFVQKYMKYMLK